MFEYTAELAQGTTDAARFGVDATLDKVHWAQIRDRIFGRIDPISASGREYRLGPRTPNVTLYEGTARFVGPKTLDTGHRRDGHGRADRDRRRQPTGDPADPRAGHRRATTPRTP